MTTAWTAAIVSARKAIASAGGRDIAPGAAAKDLPPSRVPSDRRGSARRRTRLRSGKVIDGAGQFVIECLIVDRSSLGGKLRLPGACAVPPRFMLFDDQSGELLQAAIIWRRDRELGIRFSASDRNDRFRVIADAMRRKYYAMRR